MNKEIKTNEIQIGLLGCGVIGTQVATELLNGNLNCKLADKNKIKLKKILVNDLNKSRGNSIPESLFTNSPDEILLDPDIDIIIEVMGGEKPAYDCVIKAIQNSKHLVTANKELIAKHGPQIFGLAHEKKVQIKLDATVGGGIPIINTIMDSLKANQITEVVGILNGTTNYILSEMKNSKKTLEAALKEAQDKGYAESDPTNDLEGIDAKYKTSILASLAFHQYIAPDQVQSHGIKSISPADFHFAEELGFSIKLLGLAKQFEDGHISASVYPSLVDADQPLARIDGVLNAVEVRGDLIRELMLVGPGAGPKPTSSAILGDLLSLIKNISSDFPLPYKVLPANARSKAEESSSNEKYRFYTRLRVNDKVGVIRDLGIILAKHQISLESISQKAHTPDSSWEKEGEATLIFLTHSIGEDKLQIALDEIKQLNPVNEICCILRVFE